MALFIFFCLNTVVFAQKAGDTPLAGKRIGLYLTKKNFSYSSDYHQMFAGFVRKGDSIGLSGEHLKLAAAIRIGYYWADLMQTQLSCDTVAFLNASTNARTLVRAVDEAPGQLKRICAAAPPGLDYLLLVEKLNFTTEEKNSVAGFSNTIFLKKRKVHKAMMVLRLVDIAKARQTGEAVVAFNEDAEQPLVSLIQPGEGPAAQMLGRMLDLGMLFLTASMGQ